MEEVELRRREGKLRVQAERVWHERNVEPQRRMCEKNCGREAEPMLTNCSVCAQKARERYWKAKAARAKEEKA